MNGKKLWNVFHLFDADVGDGMGVDFQEELVLTIYDTDEESKAFEKKHNELYMYDDFYCLWCHQVRLEEVKPIDVLEVNEEELEKHLSFQDEESD